MLSFSQVKSAGSAGNYYTEKDNYYVIGAWRSAGRVKAQNCWDLKER